MKSFGVIHHKFTSNNDSVANNTSCSKKNIKRHSMVK
jgi:hypothetical protein